MSGNLPNVAQNDKWKYYFSNFPSVMTTTLDIRYFNQYVRNITLPDFNVNYIESTYGAFTTSHPINMLNDYSPTVTIEFQISENYYNYAAFYNYFIDLKTGRIAITEDTFKDHCFQYIRAELLDNQGQKDDSSLVIEMTNCKMTSLSSLPLQYGVSEGMTFSVGFKVEEVKFKAGTIVPQMVLPNDEILKAPGFQDQYNPLSMQIKND